MILKRQSRTEDLEGRRGVKRKIALAGVIEFAGPLELYMLPVLEHQLP